MKQGKLVRMARGLLLRRKMIATAEALENKIQAFLLKEGKEEMVSGGLKISLRENGRIEIVELPLLNLKQMKLRLKKPKTSKKGDNR